MGPGPQDSGDFVHQVVAEPKVNPSLITLSILILTVIQSGITQHRGIRSLF